MHFSIKDNLRASVEAASNGRRTVLYDDYGNPSVMYIMTKDKFKKADLGGEALLGTGYHEAFIVHGKEVPEIFVSVTHNVLGDGGCAVSWPGVDPQVYITYDDAVAACKKKGKGWHVMSNAEWMALALSSWKNGTMPHGNNNYGSDIDYPKEKGVPAAYDGEGRITRTKTCSGPDTWFHDHTRDGVDGMNGNIWDWIGGMKLIDAKIYVAGEDGVAMNNFDIVDSHRSVTNWLDTGLYYNQTNPITVTKNVTVWNNTDHTNEDLTGGVGHTFGTMTANATVPAYFKSLGSFLFLINTRV